MYYQGDIILISYPFTDLTLGKKRPAIVISNSAVNNPRDVILAQITSKKRNDQFSFTLKVDCLSCPLIAPYNEVRCHKLFTAEKNLIHNKVSSLKLAELPNLVTKITSLLK